MVIATCKSNAIDNLTSTIIQSLEETYLFADIEKDQHLSYVALSLTSDINIEDLYSVIEVPLDVFVNFNNNNNITVLSGLTFPKTRIKKIINKIEQNKDNILKILIILKPTELQSPLTFLKI